MKTIFITFLLTVLSTSTYAAAPVRNNPTPFELGKKYYDQGNPVRALDYFAAAIQSAQDVGNRNKAFYYQGLTFYEQGLYYASFVSFRNVLLAADANNREVYEKSIKNVVHIADKLNMVDSIGAVLEKLPPQLIPNSMVATSRYAVGLSRYFAGDLDKAAENLKSVSTESPYFPKANFYLGAISTKKKSYKEAIFYFNKTYALTRTRKEMYALSELAKLNLARTYYSMGDMEHSLNVYAQFLSSSPHWLTVLTEAGWPLMRVNDTIVSLGNLHTILSPFYREELVGEAYVLRTTILFQLCKYEEMKLTLADFFRIYDPILKAFQLEENTIGGPEAYYKAVHSGKGMNASFLNYIKRDLGIQNDLKTLDMLRAERINLIRLTRNDQVKRIVAMIDQVDRDLSRNVGIVVQKLHKRKLGEILEQREQANYLKVEIVTGEKEMIENQKGLPAKKFVDVETSVARGFLYWPYYGEYWEDELGNYVYTVESSCVN